MKKKVTYYFWEVIDTTFFLYRINLKSQDGIELPINYFVEMTNQLESFLDQVKSTRHCVTPGCDGKKH